MRLIRHSRGVELAVPNVLPDEEVKVDPSEVIIPIEARDAAPMDDYSLGDHFRLDDKEGVVNDAPPGAAKR